MPLPECPSARVPEFDKQTLPNPNQGRKDIHKKNEANTQKDITKTKRKIRGKKILEKKKKKKKKKLKKKKKNQN